MLCIAGSVTGPISARAYKYSQIKDLVPPGKLFMHMYPNIYLNKVVTFKQGKRFFFGNDEKWPNKGMKRIRPLVLFIVDKPTVAHCQHFLNTVTF